jgi:PKD domain
VKARAIVVSVAALFAVTLGAAIVSAAVVPAVAQAKFIGGLIPDGPAGAGANIDGVSSDGPAGASARTVRLPELSADLPYGGGRVLNSNHTHAIFWEPAGSGLAFDPGYESLVETFLSDVAADSHKTTNTFSLTGQYRDSKGPAAYNSTYAGAIVDTDPLPPSGCTEPSLSGPGWSVCLTDDQLETEIEQVVSANNLPTTGGNVYFMITPDGFGSCTGGGPSSCALGGSANGYCGYHSETPNGILYAVIPYNAIVPHCRSDNPRPNESTADPTLSTISHEQMEMITDPDGDAWVDSEGDEAADLCLTAFGPGIGGQGDAIWNESINGGHFYLQELWSNASHACEARAQPDSLSFAWVRQPSRDRMLALTAHGSDPQGRLVSFNWTFGDGQNGLGRRVSHMYRVPGAYRIMLRATDNWGNWAFFGRTVRVKARGAAP